MMNDWMKQVRQPTQYRVGNARINLKLNRNFLKMILFSGIFLLVIYIFIRNSNYDDSTFKLNNDKLYSALDEAHRLYNSTYPLSEPVINRAEASKTYQLAIIADMDTNSKLKGSGSKFSSYLLRGTLKMFDDLKRGELKFDSEPSEILSEYSYGDRGMELSDLTVFNGHLYSCDDRTGIIYEIRPEKKLAVPWVILVDGDGRNTGKGFKCEWMTVKDQKLFVGGLGKEWTTAKGVFVNHNPQWIKVVGHLGQVIHVDWKESYNKIRSEGGYSYPGYMVFESCAWNELYKKWFFLPRRASKEAYDENLDERRATNLMITADEDFKSIVYKEVGEVKPTRGYSAFKFVPNTNEKIIVGLKSEEDSGITRSYATLFNVDGDILVDDILVSNKLKYEGIEFV